MLIGSGAMMNPKKADELAKAVTKMGIPVYLSGMGRGLLGKENDLQMRHKRREAIKESDLIILAGVPNDFRLDYGNHIGGRPFVSINRSKECLSRAISFGIAWRCGCYYSERKRLFAGY
jgi:thiamine pyrophosphate-dependent acetolactate synthase large subunit-like protein